MGMTATYDNIFVEPMPEKEGSIHVPPMFRRKHQTVMKGTTIKCGPQAIVGENEVILFNKWQDNFVTVNGKTMLIIKPHHILAIQ